jgi:hypothetical protein
MNEDNEDLGDLLDQLNSNNTREVAAVYLTLDNDTVRVNVGYVSPSKERANILLLFAQQQIKDKLAKKENDV